MKMEEDHTKITATSIASTLSTAAAAASTSSSSSSSSSNVGVGMSSIKFKDVILETIDQLRQRKARPDLERISHMLQRKHGIRFHETEAILGKLVESQVVFKVDYKGSTSYRNAAKWRINHLPSGGSGGSSGATGTITQNSDQVSQKIREAIRALARGGGNSSSQIDCFNNINNNSNNNSIGGGGGVGGVGTSSGGGRKGRQQQNNNENNSGVALSSVTPAASSGLKKSNTASLSSLSANLSTPSNLRPIGANKESSLTGKITAIKRSNSGIRADKASTQHRTPSPEDKNNNSKSPADSGSSVAPAAAAAADTILLASSSSSSSACSSSTPSIATQAPRRNSGKKVQSGPSGVSVKDLESWLNKQDSDNPLVKNLLVTALQREVQSGWLKRLRNGNYIDVASVANSTASKKKNNTNNKTASTTPVTPSGVASLPVSSSSSSSINTGGIISPLIESSVLKSNTTTHSTTANASNNNSIIIFTNSANSSTNSAATVNSSPPKSSFISQPTKASVSHGIKRSASVASGQLVTASQPPQKSPSNSTIIETDDVISHDQQSNARLLLVPNSTPAKSSAHPTLLLPLSPTHVSSTDSDRRTALLTTSSVSLAFSSSSSSSPLSSSSPGFNYNSNGNALARGPLSASLSTQSAVSSDGPGPSRESVPTRRDNNAKITKSTALHTLPGGTTNAPVPSKRGRPASKRKRFKKTPGPEFETEDILKSEPEKCVTCLQTAQSNKYGQPEDLLVCKDCNTTVHPSCMDYCEELALRARNSPWQCIECKTCYVCGDSGDGDSMLFCDACDKGYHMKCHVPHVEQKPKGKWECGQCVSDKRISLEQPMEFETSNSEESRASTPSATGLCREPMEASGPSCLPTPCDSPVQPDSEEKEIGKDNECVSLPMLRDFQGPYPDAANWTIDDVVDFFKSAGFVSQAEAFREQEIDGKSLLLMKRSDVLTGLSLKLGPALKMYIHVQNLQLAGQSSFVNGI